MRENNKEDAKKWRLFKAEKLIESCLLVCKDGKKYKAFMRASDTTEKYIRNPDSEIPEDVRLEIYALSRKKQKKIGVTKVKGLEECYLLLETLYAIRK